MLPILSIASIGLLFSTVFRNSGAAIVGTLMFSLLLQLVSILPGLGGLHPYLLSTQFDAWQGLLLRRRTGPDCALDLGLLAVFDPSLAIAATVFLRRDVAES